MEQQIQDLIASIRKEGIDEANAESARIIEEALAKAASIISDAKAESESMLASARKQLDIDRAGAEASIKQAARDAAIALRKSMEDRFSSILRAETAAKVKGKDLVDLISIVLQSDASSKAVELSPEDCEALSAELAQRFASEIRKGLVFRPSSAVSSGFRVSEKDGSGYIDISDEECVNLLMPYLSESIRRIIG